MEFAGVALAIVPILFKTLESYRAASNTLHTYRHYSREVDRSNDLFKVQKRNFLNECQWLLQLVRCEDPDEPAISMLKSTAHPAWQDEELDLEICSELGDRAGPCQIIIKWTLLLLQEVEIDLTCFDVLRSESKKVRISPYSYCNDSTLSTLQC